MHAYCDGCQLFQDVPLEVQGHRPLGLVEGVEFEFIRIETRRDPERCQRISRFKISPLTASNKFDSYVLRTLGKNPQRDVLVAADVISRKFAVFLGLSE